MNNHYFAEQGDYFPVVFIKVYPCGTWICWSSKTLGM